jgi:hypothetical protein
MPPPEQFERPLLTLQHQNLRDRLFGLFLNFLFQTELVGKQQAGQIMNLWQKNNHSETQEDNENDEKGSLEDMDVELVARNMSPRKIRKHQGLQISSALDTWVPKLDHYHSMFMLVMESHETCRREKRIEHLDPRCKSPSLPRSHRPLGLFLVEWQIRRTLPPLRQINDKRETKLNI